MNINISQSQQLEIFSKVDKNGSGSLQMSDFMKAIFELKKLLIEETIQKMGLAPSEYVVSLAISMIMLLLMFAFIFIAIMAFSPVSSFSSVTNTMLPLVAGGSVNKNPKENNEDAD